MHAAPQMIQFENVTKRYGTGRRSGAAAALRSVTLELAGGETCAIVGPNGAGKSTLFALTLGYLRPSDGDVTIDGLEPRDYVRTRGACYLPERFGPPAAWRVRDTLRAFARADGEPAARADEALERWGLGDHADKELGELSHGLLQRTGLAQALLAPRELVVLDEPHEGLDPLWRVRLREAVLELRTLGRTVLIASHDLAEVERMTDRVVLLDDGQVRDVFETVAPDTPTRYRIRLAGASGGFFTAFGITDDGAATAVTTDQGDGSAVTYDVEVRDADELSARLAAAIAGGARVVAVEPRHEPLEERVRRALGEEAE